MRRFILSILLVSVLVSGCSDALTDTPTDEDMEIVPPEKRLPNDVESELDNPGLIPNTRPEDACVADSVTCYPVILAHGFAANRDLLEFVNVAVGLEAAGYAVYEAEVAPYNSVEVRGAQLAEQIDFVLKTYDARKVNVIAHSMGGLDIRYVISTLGYGDRVASATTISSPHRGTYFAELVRDLPGQNSALVRAFLELIGGGDIADDPDLKSALFALSETGTERFNEKNLDDERVYYQSWAGLSNVAGVGRPDDDELCGSYHNNNMTNDVMDVLLTPIAPFTARGLERQPNDGLITVASAKWGTFRGCIRADHLDEIGQLFDFEPNDRTGFFQVDFYLDVAADLAEQGF